ncbi:MAG: glycosyltransferase family 39 protein [Pseudomonadota bacterium]|nr:MAG: glycosyltransferase family 39 protein [Pseudomonadota bacterium]
MTSKDSGRSTPARPVSELFSDPRLREKLGVEEIELSSTPPEVPRRRTRGRDPATRLEDGKLIAVWFGLWALLALATLFGRSAWPTDETRFLAVAWEMWVRGDFLLPTVNEQLYSQAPLVPWLIHLGWAVFGVVEWWARLVPLSASLLSLVLTWRIALLLWPNHGEVARFAPLVLLGTVSWSAFAGLASAHHWLVATVLFAVWSILIIWRRRDHRAWLLLALATGLGLLTQGWVFALYVYPVALLIPLWAREGRRPEWGYWYLDIAKSLIIGALPLALWLLAIGWRAGWTSVYELTLRAPPLLPLDILPIRPEPWWYAVWLPIVFLPWSVWPIVWLRHWQLRRAALNAGLLFCLVWVLASVAGLAAIPGAQAQWLAPLLPAGALVVSFLALDEELRGADENRLLAAMTMPVVLLGAAVIIAPKLPQPEWAPDFVWSISPLVGFGIMVVGVALAWLPVRETRRRVSDMAIVGTLFVVLAVLGLGVEFDRQWSVTGTAQYLSGVERAGRPIAQIGDYHGEYHFAGRLTRPIAVLSAARANQWAENYPNGVIIADETIWRPQARTAVALHKAQRHEPQLVVWDARSLLAVAIDVNPETP